MKVEVTDLENSKKALSIEIPEDVVTGKINEAFRQVNLSSRLKGFRAGRVPRNVLRTHFWPKIESAVIKDLVPEYFEKALEEKKLDLIGQPEFEGDVHVMENAPLSFKVIVNTWPKVEVPPDYQQIELVKEPVKVTEEDVQRELKELQEQNAKYQVVADRVIKEDDLVIFDYEAWDRQDPEWKEDKQDVAITVGSKQFLPLFSEKMLGMNKGEEKEFDDTLPADYPKKELANRKISFKVTIKEIKEKVLPEIDDDFAKDVGADTLAALKEDLGKNIRKKREEEVRSRMVNSLLDKLLASVSIEPPEIMVESETQILSHDIQIQLASQGRMIEQNEANLAKLREDLRETAIRNVKISIVLQEIAIREGIEVPQEEIDSQLWLLVKKYNKSLEEIRSSFEDKLERNLLERKTVDFLLEHALIKEQEAVIKEQEKE